MPGMQSHPRPCLLLPGEGWLADVSATTRLTDRLREATHYAIANNSVGLKQIDAMIEAADRIDALEAALRKIANAEAGPLGRQGIAREALGDTDA